MTGIREEQLIREIETLKQKVALLEGQDELLFDAGTATYVP